MIQKERIDRVWREAEALCRADGQGIVVSDVLVLESNDHSVHLQITIPPGVDIHSQYVRALASNLASIDAVEGVLVLLSP